MAGQGAWSVAAKAGSGLAKPVRGGEAVQIEWGGLEEKTRSQDGSSALGRGNPILDGDSLSHRTHVLPTPHLCVLGE